MASGESSSPLLVDEYFAAQDPRFLSTFRQFRGYKRVAAFTDRWKVDPRPWAREQIFKYLAEPLNCPTHQPVVKHLFKHAEEKKDDELMAVFMHLFDCLIRLKRKIRYRYDYQTRQSSTEEYLQAQRDTIPLLDKRMATDWRGKQHEIPVHTPKGARLFSNKTRQYLRRRAWRFFRKLGYLQPDTYTRRIAPALSLYIDADVSAGEHMLESWGLMHACFHHHDALEWSAVKCKVKDGRSIAELSPAPRFPDLWKKPEAGDILFDLVTSARSRLVRVWAQQLLRKDHAERLANISADDLIKLLDHPNEEVQQFGAELIDSMRGLDKLPLKTWLRLLETKNAGALAIICEAMGKHVSASRLELADCITLAKAQPTPVARMGLAFLKQRTINSAVDREAIAAVADAKCAATGRELSLWALTILGTKGAYELEQVIRFFDSLLLEVRDGAWAWLISEANPKVESQGYRDAKLWARLIETPFDDLRMKLIDLLEQRVTQAKIAGKELSSAALPGGKNADLTPIWSAVLLAVHRGGRAKLKALRQISDALRENPQRAEALVPVLAVAIRSVRPAEARPGLAAIVSAIETQPALASTVSKYLPELSLMPA